MNADRPTRSVGSPSSLSHSEPPGAKCFRRGQFSLTNGIVQAVRFGLCVVLAVIIFWLAMRATNAGSPSSLLPSHFEGYRYTVTTRLAVMSVTNRSVCFVEFTGPVEIKFSDGWQPRPCVVRSELALEPGASGQWVF